MLLWSCGISFVIDGVATFPVTVSVAWPFAAGIIGVGGVRRTMSEVTWIYQSGLPAGSWSVSQSREMISSTQLPHNSTPTTPAALSGSLNPDMGSDQAH